MIKQVRDFIKGDTAETVSLLEKIENDFNLVPTRHIKKYPLEGNISEVQLHELEGLSLNPRREKPMVYLSEDAPAGYRLLFGVFDFKESIHGAILLDAQGQVAHVWNISQKDVTWAHENDMNVYPHGFEVAPDGSIVTAYDSGSSLTKYDYHGNIVWRIRGGFHHSIAFDGDNAIWLWGDTVTDVSYGKNLVKIDYTTGEVLKEFPLVKVMEANPDIDIFGIRQKDLADGSSWTYEPWHENDIDPLPAEWEEYYPGFKTGDLLVSLRSPNLIFVMDPETLKVKWWRQGLTRRQHDPDWNSWGTVTIFNNNMHRGYSSIVELNPVTYEHRILLDGRTCNFYSWMRGKHQLLSNRDMLITSSEQGRVFETDENGNITFEFINRFDQNEKTLVVSEARFLPQDFFKGLPQ